PAASPAPITTARTSGAGPGERSALDTSTVIGSTASTVPHAYQNTMLIAAVLPTGVSAPTNRAGEKLPRNTLTSAPPTSTGMVTTSRARGRRSPATTHATAAGTPTAMRSTRHGTAACH